MSRIVVLLLLLVCCRSPSNAELVHDAGRHPAVAAATDVLLKDVDDRKPGNNFARAPSDARDHGDRKTANVADDDDDDDGTAAAAARLSDNEVGDEHDTSKRKWGKVSLQAWGKRRWSAANSKAAWGKRDKFDDGVDIDRNWMQKDLTDWNERRQEEAGKRRWSANNGMRAWGKRSRSHDDGRSKRSLRDDDEFALAAAPSFEQRRPAPVKRQWRKTADRYGGPKRTWEFNTMHSWGKRRANWFDDDDDLERLAPKRAWSSDNSLRIWGKRGLPGARSYYWDRP